MLLIYLILLSIKHLLNGCAKACDFVKNLGINTLKSITTIATYILVYMVIWVIERLMACHMEFSKLI